MLVTLSQQVFSFCENSLGKIVYIELFSFHSLKYHNLHLKDLNPSQTVQAPKHNSPHYLIIPFKFITEVEFFQESRASLRVSQTNNITLTAIPKHTICIWPAEIVVNPDQILKIMFNWVYCRVTRFWKTLHICTYANKCLKY